MTATKIHVSGLSGRYAMALFELALDADALKAVESDVATLSAALEASDDLRALVGSPLLSRAEQKAAMAGLAAHFELQALTSNFLGTLAANRRLGVLKAALADFGRLLGAHRGELSAEVTSAKALTKTQSEALRKSLKAAMGRDVAITTDVDEGLLGGLVVKIGSRMIDSSLKTKLDTLSVAMKGVQ